MFNNVVLDIVIGLVFIFLLYSLLATIIQEILATKLGFRAKVLERALIRMLEDGKSTSNKLALFDRLNALAHLLFSKNELKGKSVVPWFYAHPLIKYASEDNYFSKPAYLKAESFSRIILDMLRGMGSVTTNDIQTVSNSLSTGMVYQLPIDINNDLMNPAIKAIRLNLSVDAKDRAYIVNATDTVALNEDTRIFLLSLWNDSNGDVETFRKKIENWFDFTMERATGWYKRHTQMILFIIGLFIAIAFNVDTISIVDKLRKDPKLREQMVQAAGDYMQKNQSLAVQIATLKKENYNTEALESQLVRQTKWADTLQKRADNLVKSDIKKVNELMGLGWQYHARTRVGFTACTHSLLKGTLCRSCNPRTFGWKTAVGWLLTALAVSLGAPFWYDMLGKLMKLRGSGGNAGKNEQTNTTGNNTQVQPVQVNVNTQTSEEAVG